MLTVFRNFSIVEFIKTLIHHTLNVLLHYLVK